MKTLFIDADAFVNILKPIVLKAINRLSIPTVVVSNKKVFIGDSPYIRYIIVEQGADKADKKILQLCQPEDLVITADIPLADKIVSKGAFAIDHRGDLFTEDNIKHRLAIRDLLDSIRESGEMTKGPKPFTPKDAHNFANQLDKFLTKYFKKSL